MHKKLILSILLLVFLALFSYGYATFQANDIHNVTGYTNINSKHKIHGICYLVVEQSNKTFEIECDENIYNKIVCSPQVTYYLSYNYRILLASGDNRHSGSGEKRQFWSTENSHLQFE